MKKSLLLLLAAATTLATFAENKTQQKNSEPQLVYSLPKTLIAIDVNVVKSIQKAGPYAQYSERLLAIKNPVTEDKTSWYVSSINVHPIAIADKNKTFQLESGDGLTLNKQGIICGLNIDADINALRDTDASNEIQVEPSNTDFAPQAYNEEQLVSNSTAHMAEVAAKQIYHIRDSRIDLITGDNERLPADGESFKIMLNEMDKAENSITELFVGKKINTAIKKQFTYEPSSKQVKNELLFRISPESGIVDKDDLSGTPVYISVTPTKTDMPPVDAQKSNGIFYYIPGKAHITLSMANNILFDEDVEIAQLGSLQSLPSSIGKGTQIYFNPNTGAIINIGKK
jgi:hypothetical protein